MSFVPRSLEELAQEWPSDIDHISASSLKMAHRCEEQFRRVYLKKERKAPSLSMLAGRADHKAIETSMVQKIESHIDLPVSDVVGFYEEALMEQIEDSGGVNELEWQPDVNKNKEVDLAYSEGGKSVASYHTQISPQVQPLQVEEQFVIAVPELPVELIGYIDLLAQDPFFTDTRIIDRKSTKRYTAKINPDWRFQGEIYQLAQPYPHEWHVSTPKKIDTTLRIPLGNTKMTERMLTDTVAKIGFLYRRYGPDEVWPATGKLHTFACSYCGFRPTCWAWQD